MGSTLAGPKTHRKSVNSGPVAISDDDRDRLSRCVELAREALDDGDEPFGSILVDDEAGHASRTATGSRTATTPDTPSSRSRGGPSTT